MPQSEDKLKLTHLETEIRLVNENIKQLEMQLKYQNDRVIKLLDRKKSMENYLNSDNN